MMFQSPKSVLIQVTIGFGKVTNTGAILRIQQVLGNVFLTDLFHSDDSEVPRRKSSRGLQISLRKTFATKMSRP